MSGAFVSGSISTADGRAWQSLSGNAKWTEGASGEIYTKNDTSGNYFYDQYTFKAKESGTFNFEWIDDNGEKYTMSRKMTVS